MSVTDTGGFVEFVENAQLTRKNLCNVRVLISDITVHVRRLFHKSVYKTA